MSRGISARRKNALSTPVWGWLLAEVMWYIDPVVFYAVVSVFMDSQGNIVISRHAVPSDECELRPDDLEYTERLVPDAVIFSRTIARWDVSYPHPPACTDLPDGATTAVPTFLAPTFFGIRSSS